MLLAARHKGLALYDLRFQHPETHWVSGPSGCGKTYRTAQILRSKDTLIQNGEKIKNVIFCYAQWQPEYDKLQEEGVVTEWKNKMPTDAEFKEMTIPFKHKGGSIVVIDDFMGKIGEDLDEIFRVSARHSNASVFVLFQSLFPPQKLSRQISLNTKYMHIHKNVREMSQLGIIARQMRPRYAESVTDAYRDVSSKKYSCLLLDFTQECDEDMRVRSRYLPSEQPMIIYAPKK